MLGGRNMQGLAKVSTIATGPYSNLRTSLWLWSHREQNHWSQRRMTPSEGTRMWKRPPTLSQQSSTSSLSSERLSKKMTMHWGWPIAKKGPSTFTRQRHTRTRETTRRKRILMRTGNRYLMLAICRLTNKTHLWSVTRLNRLLQWQPRKPGIGSLGRMQYQKSQLPYMMSMLLLSCRTIFLRRKTKTTFIDFCWWLTKKLSSKTRK